MIRLNNEIIKKKQGNLKILLQIHDELIFETDIDDINSSCKLINETMTSVQNSNLHSFSIPLLIDINSGYNWGELH